MLKGVNMCEECGCHDKKSKTDIKKNKADVNTSNSDVTIGISASVLEDNNRLAHEIWHILHDKKILCVNIMGAPGSGKTTFIEGISGFIPSKDIAVIQGDLEGDIDKKRLEKRNILTYQINTHSGCHLNAMMIKNALDIFLDKIQGNIQDSIHGKKFLFIENVGNLVCPAGVKIGQHIDVVVSSAAEGHDKPRKYPLIFLDADLIVVSKYDLKEAVDFDEDEYIAGVRRVNAKARILNVSSKDKVSFKEAAHFLEHEREHMIGEVHHH